MFSNNLTIYKPFFDARKYMQHIHFEEIVTIVI